MAMYKSADLHEVTFTFPNEAADDEVVFNPESEPEGEVVEMAHPTEEGEFSFKNFLPFLPGAPEELVSLDHSTGDEADGEKVEKVEEPVKNLDWVKDYLQKIPRHSGETLGLERAKAYLMRALSHLSKMVQEDHSGSIDISQAEEARVEIESGIERLKKELQKREKKAGAGGDLKKEGNRVGGIMVTVPLIVSTIARICINSTISGGKDIENTFQRLAKKYNLNEREKVEVIQLLQDMNMPIRRDMGFMLDDKEQYGYSSEHNYNFVPNYQA